MGILDYELDKVPELEVAPDGEWGVEVAGADGKIDKNGKPGVQFRFRVDRPNTKMCSTWISFPHETDTEDERNNKLRRIKGFRDAFKLNFKTASQLAAMVEDESVLGSKAFAILSVSDSTEYGEQNNIKRFVIPKV